VNETAATRPEPPPGTSPSGRPRSSGPISTSSVMCCSDSPRSRARATRTFVPGWRRRPRAPITSRRPTTNLISSALRSSWVHPVLRSRTLIVRPRARACGPAARRPGPWRAPPDATPATGSRSSRVAAGIVLRLEAIATHWSATWRRSAWICASVLANLGALTTGTPGTSTPAPRRPARPGSGPPAGTPAAARPAAAHRAPPPTSLGAPG
jgi:hypothetical protein